MVNLYYNNLLAYGDLTEAENFLKKVCNHGKGIDPVFTMRFIELEAYLGPHRIRWRSIRPSPWPPTPAMPNC